MKIKLTDIQKKAYDAFVQEVQERKSFISWLESRFGKNLRKMYELAKQIAPELQSYPNTKNNVDIDEKTAKACLEFIKLNNKETMDFMDAMAKVAGENYAQKKVSQTSVYDLNVIGTVLNKAIKENDKTEEKPLTK